MKKILITGAEGMIGRELIDVLKDGNRIFIADIKSGFDLRDKKCCLSLCEGKDEVYHLAGIKGNPKMTAKLPVDFMGNMLQFDTNMIMAAQECEVKKFLYTSSIAVLNQETDKYPAWAKSTAEKLIEAMRIQYPNGTKYCIVRPANVYGRYDDFSKPNLMVISNLINKALTQEYIDVLGDGSNVRDFINSVDVALAMKLVMEKMPEIAINIGSGKEYTIKEIAQIISDIVKKPIKYVKTEFPGDKKRLMDITELKNLGFKNSINIKDGIKEVIRCKTKKYL